VASGLDDLLAELLEPLGDVTFRRMFGGRGIFRRGLMFAFVSHDTLYFKADETTIAEFQAEGCGPFIYEAKGRPHIIRYWRAPERLYDEPDEFRVWAQTAFGVAKRANEDKPRKSRRKTNA
jgi:DNA transformation protein